MATPFLSEIKIFSFGFAPKGWALANGQLPCPSTRTRLCFPFWGTTYGGDGRVNFGLPNLQGRGAHAHGKQSYARGKRRRAVAHRP